MSIVYQCVSARLQYGCSTCVFGSMGRHSAEGMQLRYCGLGECKAPCRRVACYDPSPTVAVEYSRSRISIHYHKM